MGCNAAEHRVQRTVGIRPAKLAFFYTLSFFCFDGESTPAPPPLTQTVRQLDIG
jgi:hypothetical protein